MLQHHTLAHVGFGAGSGAVWVSLEVRKALQASPPTPRAPAGRREPISSARIQQHPCHAPRQSWKTKATPSFCCLDWNSHLWAVAPVPGNAGDKQNVALLLSHPTHIPSVTLLGKCISFTPAFPSQHRDAQQRRFAGRTPPLLSCPLRVHPAPQALVVIL